MTFEEKAHKAYMDLSAPDFSGRDAGMFCEGWNAAKKELDWQLIETAPKDGTEFFAWDTNTNSIAGFLYWNYVYKAFSIKGWGPLKHKDFTHWMLPEPPANSEANLNTETER